MDDIHRLMARCRTQGVTLDTNVFLLAVVGSCDVRLIGRVKRASPYSVDDYRLLSSLLAQFDKVWVTPGVLAETCNLLDADNRSRNHALFGALKSLCSCLQEHHADASSLMVLEPFRWIGYTDSSVIELARRGCLAVSDDLPLKSYLERHNLPVINFTALRTARWLTP